MGSFFRNQTFPANWHRHDGPAGINGLVDVEVGPHPEVVPGMNGPDGKYIPDTVDPVRGSFFERKERRDNFLYRWTAIDMRALSDACGSEHPCCACKHHGNLETELRFSGKHHLRAVQWHGGMCVYGSDGGCGHINFE